jgi:hypothetical protein
LERESYLSYHYAYKELSQVPHDMTMLFNIAKDTDEKRNT